MNMDPLGELRAVVTGGNIAAFHTMLRNDPLLLEKATLFPLTDNILHIASLSGNLDFVRVILDLKPGFAWDRNKDGLSPLHMASALGRDEIVDVLLEVGPAELCLLQDNEGRTPLHFAAINGKIPVIKTLLLKCPKELEIETSRGETALHLALKNKQANAFRRLAHGLRDERLLLILKYWKSIQQLAKETNQLQELDVLDVFPTRFRFFMTLLKRYLAHSATYVHPQISQVVASIIATVTFQSVVNPPPAIWDEDKKMDYSCLYQMARSPPSLCKNLFDSCPAGVYMTFMVLNSVGFFSSVMFMMLFNNGRIERFILATSLMALLTSYVTVVVAMSEDTNVSGNILVISFLGVGVAVAIFAGLRWATVLFLRLLLGTARVLRHFKF